MLPPMMFFQTYLFIKLLIYYLRDNCIFSFLEHSRANFNNSKSAFWELFPVNFILLDLTRGMAVFIQIRYLLNCHVYYLIYYAFFSILNNFYKHIILIHHARIKVNHVMREDFLKVHTLYTHIMVLKLEM